ncbi:hypothetical protein P3T42_003069 [Paraburkholderia sp. GAS38]
MTIYLHQAYSIQIKAIFIAVQHIAPAKIQSITHKKIFCPCNLEVQHEQQ